MATGAFQGKDTFLPTHTHFLSSDVLQFCPPLDSSTDVNVKPFPALLLLWDFCSMAVIKKSVLLPVIIIKLQGSAYITSGLRGGLLIDKVFGWHTFVSSRSLGHTNTREDCPKGHFAHSAEPRGFSSSWMTLKFFHFQRDSCLLQICYGPQYAQRRHKTSIIHLIYHLTQLRWLSCNKIEARQKPRQRAIEHLLILQSGPAKPGAHSQRYQFSPSTQVPLL